MRLKGNNPIDSIFSREDSIVISGIAVLFMVWHHLFRFSSWLLPNVQWNSAFGYIGTMVTGVFAAFGDICVQIFAFMSGYALFVSPNAFSTNKTKRLSKFIISYWIVCAIFILFAFCTKDTLPTGWNLIQNCIGMNLGPEKEWINVPFAWYVLFYILFIFFSSTIYKYFTKGCLISDFIFTVSILILILISDAISSVYNLQLSFYLSPFISVCFGFITAKYNLFNILRNKFDSNLKFPISTYFILSLLLIPARYIILKVMVYLGIPYISLKTIISSIIAFLLIFFISEIMKNRTLTSARKFFIFTGEISLYIWFVHGIFFSGKKILQPALYSLEEPVLIYTLCLIFIIPVSWLIYKLCSMITKRL